MLDIKMIRERPQLVRDALSNRGEDPGVLEGITSLDIRRRDLLQSVEKHRADQRTLSKEIGKLQGNKQKTAETEAGIRQMIGNMKGLSDEIAREEQELRVIEDNLQARLLEIPNIPDGSVPIGKTSAGNVLAHSEGEPKKFDFPPKPHWEIGEKLGIIDFERGVKISGTRFYVLKGQGARLERALIAFMIDLHVKEHGFTEMYMPFMVKKECLYGSGNLPKFGDNLYHDAEEDFYWVPTAEVPLTNLHRDEILEPGKLPLKYVAYTPCFRREKMAAGKETRGLKRGHQFDKVEMYVYSEPERSFEELESMVNAAGDVLRRLELPFHVLRLCTGDLGFASAKTYDLEVWAPGLDEWLEVSSCSNCIDFQARRTNIRYRPQPGAKPLFPHTLNGSGLALPRVVIAILENYQREDGSIEVPCALHSYMGTDTIKAQ
ncbi:MAG: serine--tRNA ligase [Chloroflexi bacterium]|nr:serine--tRNA ligase [Chloroflexota bacterium]